MPVLPEAVTSPPRPFLPFVIHPQTGSLCYTDHPVPWPDEGFLSPSPVGWSEKVTPWPVPRIKEARLVDCGRCGRAGIQPQTQEAAARYIPGAELSVREDGTFVIQFGPNPAIPYPTGSGEDEEDGPPVT